MTLSILARHTTPFFFKYTLLHIYWGYLNIPFWLRLMAMQIKSREGWQGVKCFKTAFIILCLLPELHKDKAYQNKITFFDPMSACPAEGKLHEL